ncbi:MAG: CAP domain-containing protein [Amaricoccus sp.]
MRMALRMLAAACLLATAGQAAEAGEGAAPRLPDRLLAPISADRIDEVKFSEAVLIYSNAARRAHGLPPLAADGRLTNAAVGHAQNMARLRIHSHILPVRGQADLKQRIDRQSVQYRTAGENIAMNKVYRLVGRPIAIGGQGCSFTYGDTRQPVPIHSYATLAEDAVDRWLASPKHRASLLSPVFRRLGSGVGVDPGGTACGDVYLVQDFAD